MEMRKLVSLLLVAFLCLYCHFYLRGRYNPGVVEYSVSGSIDESFVKRLEQRFGYDGFNINIKGRLGGTRLLLTWGRDLLVRDLNIPDGDFVVEEGSNSIVIGDEAADKYFRTIDALGREIMLAGNTYSVKGIVEDDDNIYIHLSDDLKGIVYEKQFIQYLPGDNTGTDMLMQDFSGYLQSEGLKVNDIVVYKNKVFWYSNLSIILLLYILSCFLVKTAKKFILKTKGIIDGYRSERRCLYWHEYASDSKALILDSMKHLFFSAAIILSMYFLLTLLFIPRSFIPENFFSLPHYLDIIKSCYNTFLYHLENGFTGISVDCVLLNIIIAFSLFCSVLIIRRKSI